MHHSKQCPFRNVYEIIAQHWASQTRPMVSWIWTFWEIAPNSSLLMAYKNKTSIHLPVPFTFPLYLLHLLTDILSSHPERLTEPLSLVGPQTTDVILNLETLISLSSSLSVSSLSIVAILNYNFVAFLFYCPAQISNDQKKYMTWYMMDIIILCFQPLTLGFFKLSLSYW